MALSMRALLRKMTLDSHCNIPHQCSSRKKVLPRQIRASIGEFCRLHSGSQKESYGYQE